MNQEQRVQLGAQIEAARKQRGWSQQRLADESGVSENTIIAMEKGAKASQGAKIRAVLDTLGIEPAAQTIDLQGIPEDVRIFLTVAAQRLRVMDEDERARLLTDLYPRLFLDS